MDEKWDCFRCTYKNSPLNLRCMMCETLKETNPTTGKWKCSACLFSDNPLWSLSCNICDNSRDDLLASCKETVSINWTEADSWQCNACTYALNSSNISSCTMCGTVKCSAVNSKKATSTCSTCTYINPIGASKCDICDTTIAKDENYLTKWTCPVCTCDNFESHVCIFCLSEKVLSSVVKMESKWQCTECMHLNSNSRLECMFCKSLHNDKSTLEASSSNLPSTELKSLQTTSIMKSQEIEIIKIWKNICLFCAEQNICFVDDSFLPCPKSISCLPQIPYVKEYVQWLRPSSISSWNWTVYENPKPDDIVQGNIGDCWLMCALAVIAERRELVENLIPSKYSKYGVYHVRIYENGEWKMVVVDDLLPCNINGKLIFSKADRNQLWVPLIEKAMAKLNDCYEALHGGTCREALQTLTGAPCLEIDLEHGDEDEAWAYLLSSWESRFLIACACGDKINSGDTTLNYEKLGLAKNHAYSVLNVQQVEGHRLLQIRNPWKKFSWNGKWSDNSSIWNTINPVTKNKLLISRSNGKFWMCFSDVRRNFNNMVVCKVRPNWHEMRIQSTFLSHANIPLKLNILTVHKTAEFDFSVHQDNKRSCFKDGKPWLPVDILLLVFKYNENCKCILGDLVAYQRKITDQMNLTKVLEVGRYVVVCLGFNHWKVDNSKHPKLISNPVSYRFVLHCPKCFILRELMFSYDDYYLLADTIIQFVTKIGKRRSIGPDVQLYCFSRSGIIIVAENISHHSPVTVYITGSSESRNIVSTRGSQTTVDTVPPLHRQVIIVLTQKERDYYRITYTSKVDFWSKDLNIPPLHRQVKALHSPRPI